MGGTHQELPMPWPVSSPNSTGGPACHSRVREEHRVAAAARSSIATKRSWNLGTLEPRTSATSRIRPIENKPTKASDPESLDRSTRPKAVILQIFVNFPIFQLFNFPIFGSARSFPHVENWHVLRFREHRSAWTFPNTAYSSLVPVSADWTGTDPKR
jgi:hypothetical protein